MISTMGITSFLICLSSILVLGRGKSISVPPSVCFEPFNGLDCGGSPLHVLYYYKPGSRCEVAIWRGCSTRNKFQDEYECINTCIFTERAQPEEHHNVDNEDDYQLEYEEDKKTIDELVTTTIVANSGYEADDEGGGKDAGEKDTTEADGDEKADEENAATENADGENTNEGENAAEADKVNVANEGNKETGEGDEETKIEATSEGTMELGSEDIGAN